MASELVAKLKFLFRQSLAQETRRNNARIKRYTPILFSPLSLSLLERLSKRRDVLFIDFEPTFHAYCSYRHVIVASRALLTFCTTKESDNELLLRLFVGRFSLLFDLNRNMNGMNHSLIDLFIHSFIYFSTY